MSLPLRGLLVANLLLLSACASLNKKQNSQAAQDPAASTEFHATIRENEVSSEDVEKNIERPYVPAYGSIAMDYNPHVEKWMRYFQGRGRSLMETYLARSTRYLPMMKNVLRENGLPEELVYIPLIESGFSHKAHSHANAVGYWQFIRSTGKRFGLQVDTFVDERRDPVLSTRAAAEYFKALYNLHGSWHLAMASYNVGEARVKRAVTRYYTRDFWELIKKRRALPPETRNYVPKFIAAAMIAKDPEKYGFTSIDYHDPLSYDAVALTSPISISKLASNLNVEAEELRLLNPKFRTDFVPISRGSETFVRIPVGRATDAMAALSMSTTTQPKILVAENTFYRVRRGDTLSTIARKHRTTVSQLRRLNDLSNRTLLRVGRSLRVPDNGGDGIKLVYEEDAARGPANKGGTAVPAMEVRGLEYHVVRMGENLTTISRRYGLTVAELLKLNNLSNRSVLRRGQKLRVKPEAASRSATTKPQLKKKGPALASFKSGSLTKAKVARLQKEVSTKRGSHLAAASMKEKKHTVRRGETMYDVSKRYGISLNELARANNLKLNHRVMAGQSLVIPD